MPFPADFRLPDGHCVGHEWFAVGVNYPWVGTPGYDIGPNQILEHATLFRRRPTLDQIRNDFRWLKSMGVEIVRMWVFEDGEGLRWERRGRQWEVVGIDPVFKENISSIARAAQEQGVRIYWCLFQSGNFNQDRYARRPVGYQNMSSGFHNLLYDSQALDSFLEKALRPFIERLLDTPAGLFAIDIMNEPDGLWGAAVENIDESLGRMDTRLSAHSNEIRRYMRQSQVFRDLVLYSDLQYDSLSRRMISLLVRIGNFIESEFPRVLKSVGFMMYNTFSRWKDHPVDDTSLAEVLDFFDFHFYDNIDVANLQPTIPTYDTLGIDKPCIIGEYGLGGGFVHDVLYPAESGLRKASII